MIGVHRDARREGARPDWTSETERLRADVMTAARLRIEAGEHVMRTRYLFRAGKQAGAGLGVVGAILPRRRHTGRRARGRGRIVGVLARMDCIGVRVDKVVEKVRARPATEDERRELEVSDGVWVMTVERTHWQGHRPVETADIVIPADRYVLAYEILVP